MGGEFVCVYIKQQVKGEKAMDLKQRKGVQERDWKKEENGGNDVTM